MNYQADPLQVPAVTFGINGFTPSPTYDSQIVSQRGVTLAGDEPDATINASAALAGDFNGNSTVDAADYAVWRDGLGIIFMPNDYLVWRAHFGQSAGSGAVLPPVEHQTVPEPTTLWMFGFGIVVAICRCRPNDVGVLALK
jgi:hypothetical protein